MPARILILFWVCAALLAQGQPALKNPVLLPVRSEGKMGYISLQGKLVLPYKYDAAGPFSDEGIAIVGINRQYSLISTEGKEILPEAYDFIEYMGEGLFAVQKDTAWGVFHYKNGIVLPVCADFPPVLSGGACLYSVNGLWGLMDNTKKVLLQPHYDTIGSLYPEYWSYRQGKNMGVIHAGGKVLCEGEYENLTCTGLKRSGMIIAHGKSGMNVLFVPGGIFVSGAKTFTSMNAGELIALHLEKGTGMYIDSLSFYFSDSVASSIRPFANGYFVIERNGLSGITNLSGNTVLPCEYDALMHSGGNFIWISKEGKWGAAEYEGKILLPPQFDEIGEFRYGVTKVKKGKTCGLVNVNGDLTVGTIYKDIHVEKGKARLFTTDSKTEIARMDALGNLMDKNSYGNLKTIRIGKPPVKQPADIFTNNPVSWNIVPDTSAFKFGWFFNSTIRKWGMTDSTGKIIIPAVFHDIDVHEDLGLTLVSIRIPTKEFNICGKEVKRDTKFGLINHLKRRIVLPAQYLNIFIEDFYKAPDAVARVMDEYGYFHYVSRMGKKAGTGAVYIGDFIKGMARINKGGVLKETCDTCPEKLYPSWTTRVSDSTARITHSYGNNQVFFCAGGKWGWIDIRGEEVIPVQFQHAGEFFMGRSIVKLGGKYGVIDTAGKILVKTEYDQVSVIASPLKTNDPDSLLYQLKKNLKKSGFVNCNGKFITDLKYQQIRDFREGLAAVMFRNKWGFVDTNGREVTEMIYDKVEDFRNGFAAVKKKGKWGFIDREGKISIQNMYQDVGIIADGMAWFFVNGKYGFADEWGNELIPAQYQKAGDFYSGLAPVQKENSWGFINKEGKIMIPFRYKSAGSFNAWDVSIVKTDNGFGMIRPDGKELLPCAYQLIGEPSDGMVRIKQENKYGYADNLGNIVIAPVYINAQDFSEGMAAVNNGDGWFYINASGQRVNEIISGNAKPFVNGHGIISQGGKYAFVDPMGNVTSLPSGWTPQPFSEDGYSVVSVSKKGQTWLNKSGKMVVKKYYKSIKPFYSGTAPASLKGKWGIMDRAGYCITGFKFDDVGKFSDGFLGVRINSFYGIADATGKIIVPVEFEVLGPIGENKKSLFYAERKGTIGYLNRDGSWMWEPK